MKLDNLDERVEMLERQLVVLREELRREIKQAAHELRGDSDFIKPYWKDGAEHFTEHLFTLASRRILWVVLGAIGTAVLLWVGSTGVLTK